MKSKLQTVYVCTSCGENTPRWLGKCPSCGEWNTLVEDVIRIDQTAMKQKSNAVAGSVATALDLASIDTNEEASRIITGITELDRVLGGGIVLGSVVLLGGEPGAGKSTMLLQLCGAIGAQKQVLYITGEESIRQIKLRADRLHIASKGISVAAENNIETIVSLIDKSKPQLVVIDSIQTMISSTLSSSAGSVSQVKECTAQLQSTAKEHEIPVFVVGHVNKDGAIAGPKVMEHIVDTVLYFEGDRTLPYRILRATKNRYGSTNEIGMFDMTSAGLVPIENPSEMLLQGRPLGVSGNCVGSLMEGTRPFMCEVQALVTKSSFGTPRRTASGFDISRANLLMAVLEKRAGFFMGNLDIYINVVGGLELDETACDLALCLAIVSSLLDKPLDHHMIAMGEVGLAGELRSVTNIETRVREAQRTGFSRAIIPKQNFKQLDIGEYTEIEILPAEYVMDAIQLI